MAVNQLIDSVNLYAEHQNFLSSVGVPGSVLTVTASATATRNGSDFNNTIHRGCKLYINFTTIAATCTVRLNLQSKDTLSGLYITMASLSLDSLTTGNINTLFAMHVYPGILVTVAGGGGNEAQFNDTLTKTMRLQASITATATAGGAAVSFQTGMDKVP